LGTGFRQEHAQQKGCGVYSKFVTSGSHPKREIRQREWHVGCVPTFLTAIGSRDVVNRIHKPRRRNIALRARVAQRPASTLWQTCARFRKSMIPSIIDAGSQVLTGVGFVEMPLSQLAEVNGYR
jgi:hypothetical protein